MRLLAVAVLTLAPAVAACADAEWTVRADGADDLLAALVQGSAERLANAGWQLTPDRGRALISRRWRAGTTWRVLPRWSASADPLPLPLAFDLEAVDAAANEAPMTVSLPAVVRREVVVLRHAVRSGAIVTCDDTTIALRAPEAVPSGAFTARCSLDAGATARRPLSAGDALRAADLGAAPSVVARSDVRLRVQVGPVMVEKSGTALADAREGETVLVRLAGSAQSVRGVVVGRNLVEVGGER